MPGRAGLTVSVVVVMMTAAIGACAQGDDAKTEVEEVVRAVNRAERERDIDAFLALHTDKGLKSFGPFSPKELRDQKTEAFKEFAREFGRHVARLVSIPEVAVEGSRATAIVESVEKGTIASPLIRGEFRLVERGEAWLIDGFDPSCASSFTGADCVDIDSPRVPKGAAAMRVRAVDHRFALRPTRIPPNVAFRFSNAGKEGHHMLLVRGPDGVRIETVKEAFSAPSEPKGYDVAVLGFARPGQDVNIALEKPIAAGDYFLVCVLPQGGFDERNHELEPRNPDAKLHVELGMINAITVE